VSEQQGRDRGGADLLASGPDSEGRGGGRATRVWRVAGLLAVGIVAVVAGPGLLSSEQPPSSPGRSANVAPTPGPPGVPPVRWAPRGPDVGSAFAVAALARIRVQHPGVTRLLWAGSLDGGRDRVVVAISRRAPNQSGDDTLEVAALRVLRPGDVRTARSQTIGYVREADGLIGLAWEGDDEHTRLLVLGRPAPMEVQVSSVVDYHPSGRVVRGWQDAELADGVLVTDLGQRVDPMIVVRPKDLGSSTSPALVGVRGRPGRPGPGDIKVAGVSSTTYAGPELRVLVESLAKAVSMQFDLRDADSRVLWSGQVVGGRRDSGESAAGRAALVLVRRHDGPVFQAFIYSDPVGGFESYTANAVQWSVAERLPYVFSTYGPGAPLLMISPSGPGSATLARGLGSRVHVQLDANGVGMVAVNSQINPQFGGAPVVVRDPSGHTLLRSTLVDPSSVDAFGLYL
jgi:hypothetical protein